MRYADVSRKELKFLDLTSLTVEEFSQLVPAFEEAFQERMKAWCLDGKKRTGRKYLTYTNCPLPTPEDRLLFILVYLKNNPLQVLQGELFGMPQNKANQWIHALLPVLQTALKTLGDAPARSMEQLAQRLSQNSLHDISIYVPDTSIALHNSFTAIPDSSPPIEQEKHASVDSPLFATMGRKGGSSVPKIRMNRKAIIAERKNVIR
jgi:DDE superfamily endonuclease